MASASVTLEPKNVAPLQRALMRVEAELLREDADTVGCRNFQNRTHVQRAADALIRLAETIGATGGASEARSEGFEPPTF
jgi:hypothetical protein